MARWTKATRVVNDDRLQEVYIDMENVGWMERRPGQKATDDKSGRPETTWLAFSAYRDVIVLESPDELLEAAGLLVWKAPRGKVPRG